MAWVYILRCSDGTLYLGHTANLETRLTQHTEGRGGTHTACRRPVALAYSEQHDSLDKAIARERQLKHWTRAKKEALVAGSLPSLKRLARRRLPKPQP
jgi:putative endonuclease